MYAIGHQSIVFIVLPAHDRHGCLCFHAHVFKSMTLPVAYTSLAKGDAVMYLCMEAAYDIFMAVCVIVGFVYGGILGTGIALALAGVFDWWMIYAVYGRRYGFKPDKAARPFTAAQFLCVAAALFWACSPKYGSRLQPADAY